MTPRIAAPLAARIIRAALLAGVAVCALLAGAAPASGAAPMRFGIYPGGGVGTVELGAGVARPEDETLRLAALQRLRADGRALVLHTYTSWDGIDADAFVAQLVRDVREYTTAGFDVEPTIRYRPTFAGALSPAAFAADAARGLGQLAGDRHLVSVQITNEANIRNAPDAADGAYRGAVEALVRGIVGADAALRRAGREDVRIGFNWAAAVSREGDRAFWREIGRRGGRAFRRALDWVGVDIYPGTWSSPGRVAVGDASPVRSAVRSALRRLRGENFRLARLPRRIALQISENGFPTGAGRSDAQQLTVMRASIKELLRLRSRYGVTDYRWFNLRDARTGSGHLENGYGILRDDYSEKPGFAALRSLIAKYGAPA